MILNRENYSKLSGLDTQKAEERIVHIGLGAFHRAHQAWYTDQVDKNNEWGIVAFTGRSDTEANKLKSQDGLYCLVVRSDHADEFSVVDSIVRAENGADTSLIVAAISNPKTAIITLTITEAGYGTDSDGRLDTSNPSPVLTKLAYALEDRRRAHGKAVAVVSCDNIPQNGRVLSAAIREIFKSFGSEAEQWLIENVEFVSTSVDRITPRTSASDIEVIKTLTGWKDNSPVITEPFSDWILQGEFPLGRPEWELAGAKFVKDIEPFEKRKLWLLNGAHSTLAYSGLNRGLDSVFEAINDDDCFQIVEQFWVEAIGALPVELLNLNEYREALLSRFRNNRIEHKLSQISVDGLTKITLRIVPVALANLAKGTIPDGCANSIAQWIRFVKERSFQDSQSEKLKLALSKSESERALIGLLNEEFLKYEDFTNRILELCTKQPN